MIALLGERQGNGWPHSQGTILVLGQIVFRFCDQSDGCVIRAAGGVVPADQSVMHQNHGLCLRPCVQRLVDGMRQVKSGPRIGKDKDVLSQGFAHGLFSSRPVGEGKDGGGVGVVHKSRRNEGVQEALHRGEETVLLGAEAVDFKFPCHGLIRKGREVFPFDEIFQVEWNKIFRPDRRQIKTGGLHKQGLHGFVEDVADGCLDRRISAAVERQIRFHAKQARGIHPQSKFLAPLFGVVLKKNCGVFFRPAVDHKFLIQKSVNISGQPFVIYYEAFLWP